jgi:hypothetical protein
VKVGFFSPLPPQRTGVADYSKSLLAALSKRGQVELGAESASVNLYHVGNNQLHSEIYSRAVKHPGVVVLHDAVLQHFFLGCLPREQYVEEFIYNYGEWSRGLAEQLWEFRRHSAADGRYFEYPMLRRIAESSCAVVVHNPAAAAIVRRHSPKGNVIEIPHLFEPPAEVESSAVASARRELSVPDGTLLVGVFGHLRESKRVLSVLRVVSQMQPFNIVLLIAGDCGSKDLQKAMDPFLSLPFVRRVGYLSEARFWQLAHATDVCVSLRYPAAGETSGITTRFMGIGKPVVVTEGLEVSALPESSCVRIEHGISEQATLESTFRWFGRRPSDAKMIGATAQAHIRASHDIDRVADMYWQTLEKFRR